MIIIINDVKQQNDIDIQILTDVAGATERVRLAFMAETISSLNVVRLVLPSLNRSYEENFKNWRINGATPSSNADAVSRLNLFVGKTLDVHFDLTPAQLTNISWDDIQAGNPLNLSKLGTLLGTKENVAKKSSYILHDSPEYEYATTRGVYDFVYGYVNLGVGSIQADLDLLTTQVTLILSRINHSLYWRNNLNAILGSNLSIKFIFDSVPLTLEPWTIYIDSATYGGWFTNNTTKNKLWSSLSEVQLEIVGYVAGTSTLNVPPATNVTEAVNQLYIANLGLLSLGLWFGSYNTIAEAKADGRYLQTKDNDFCTINFELSPGVLDKSVQYRVETVAGVKDLLPDHVIDMPITPLTTTNLGGIKSSLVDGDVSVLVTGIASVNGWGVIKTDILERVVMQPNMGLYPSYPYALVFTPGHLTDLNDLVTWKNNMLLYDLSDIADLRLQLGARSWDLAGSVLLRLQYIEGAWKTSIEGRISDTEGDISGINLLIGQSASPGTIIYRLDALELKHTGSPPVVGLNFIQSLFTPSSTLGKVIFGKHIRIDIATLEIDLIDTTNILT